MLTIAVVLLWAAACSSQSMAADDPASIRSAFDPIQAEDHDAQSGVVVSGGVIGWLDNGDWVRFDGVDFDTGGNRFEAYLAVPDDYAGQSIEVRLGSPSGQLVGSLTTQDTGGWGSFALQSATIQELSGIQDIVLVFSGTGGIGNLDWIRFQRSEDAVSPEPQTVPPEFFGMHIGAQMHEGWPSIPFATQRIWDSWPSVSWRDIHTAPGEFDWSTLDALVADSLANGVEDLVYTFGYTPPWASTDGTQAGAPQLSEWEDFVTRITERYGDSIRYWEIWNEPNAGYFWEGTHAQMAEMAEIAYPIIKNAGGIVLSPAPQGRNSYRWMDDYLAAGGAPYADIIAFHGYLFDAPERILTVVEDMRSVMEKHGVDDLPLWDTEHSWHDVGAPFGADYDQQSAWLARFKALSFSAGIERSFWYMWESFDFGTLYDRRTQQILPPGIAHREVHAWMVGAEMEPVQTDGVLYEARLQREGGYRAIMVWSISGTVSYTVPDGYTRLRRLDGVFESLLPGQTVSIGMKPVLLEVVEASGDDEEEESGDDDEEKTGDYDEEKKVHCPPGHQRQGRC